jgi:hypothetical protein
VNQYFFPANNWTVSNTKAVSATVDITYRTNSENPVYVNLSFFNKKQYPRNLSAAALEGGGIVYPLDSIQTLRIDSKRYELRVTTNGQRENFLPLMRSEDIILRATVDGNEHIYTPGKNFYILRDQFFADLIE